MNSFNDNFKKNKIKKPTGLQARFIFYIDK